LIEPTTNLYISSSRNLDISPYDVIISCTPEALQTTNPEYVKSKKYLHLPLQTGKLGSRDLRWQILRLPTFIESLNITDSKILVCCPTGKDLSVGVALAILCLYANDDGKITNQATGKAIDKTFIKQRLSWMTTTSPILNPSRETLKSINAFLMPDPNSRSAPEVPTGPLSSRLVLTTPNPTSTSQDADLQTPSTDSPDPPPSQPSTQTPPIPRTLFTSLENNTQPWTFTRTLASKLPTHPSGTVTGTATFTPYTFPPDAPASVAEAGPALLYSEEGEFVTDTNLRFVARRKYVYILASSDYDSDSDYSSPAEPPSNPSPSNPSPTTTPPTTSSSPYIKIHFHESDTGIEGHGDLFVEMGPIGISSDGDAVWSAKNRATHLCGGDLYTASWKFGDGMVGDVGRGGDGMDGKGEGRDGKQAGGVGMGGVGGLGMGILGGPGKGEMWWEVRYDVTGPKKDYVSLTRYWRG
jgi:tRNA A64-2'-O-ribosylphosphate transferase